MACIGLFVRTGLTTPVLILSNSAVPVAGVFGGPSKESLAPQAMLRSIYLSSTTAKILWRFSIFFLWLQKTQMGSLGNTPAAPQTRSAAGEQTVGATSPSRRGIKEH